MQVPATSYPYPSQYSQGYPSQWGPNSPAQNQSYMGMPAPANLQANPAALMPLQQAYREALQEIMKTPEKRQEFLSVVQDMQRGKLTPELLSKRMSRLLERSKADSFEKPSPAAVLTAVTLATGGGLLVGQGVKNLFTQLEQSKNSPLERIFRGVDRIPVLSYFSQGFETYLEKASKLAGIHPHPLLSLDGSYYTPAELRRNGSTPATARLPIHIYCCRPLKTTFGSKPMMHFP